MAVKKSDLYASLWKSCDKLRGGMDASQYKDYVLVLLFMKYVSDRAASGRDSLLDIPEGGSFADLVALKGKSDIGDGINKVIGKLATANELNGVIDVADFNDDSKLGKGKEMVDRLSDLIAIFEDPALDFSGNSAEGDDLLGDAYEYLMRNFATESGKSKGQFYTPAEVSRIMSAVIGIDKAKSQQETIYDPTCGSASLLLKAHAAAKSATGFDLAIYGQEMDNATAALARMNMWLHNAGGAEIENANTLSTPRFTDAKTGKLKTFNYVVANPPFSTKDWTLGVNTAADPFDRFPFGIPPAKNGDYAFLLHILASMKSTGKGTVILPHGVLFRGNAEAAIRRNIVKQGYIKGIIGLPANLFYGTGIPACIIVLDKEGAAARDSIFMIDASTGFIKDGAKNRLRERDIHRIIDTFTSQNEVEKYSRLVPIDEIADPKNDYNLNLPRYIDTSEPEDLQDLDAHLNGGMPNRDIDALDAYWSVFPKLRDSLFTSAGRDGYSNLAVDAGDIAATIRESDECAQLSNVIHAHFDSWIAECRPLMASVDSNTRPKEFIAQLGETLLANFHDTKLVDEYAIYQSLMEFWETTMQDDIYLILDAGWEGAASPVKLDAKTKDRVDFTSGKEKFKSELIPANLIVDRFCQDEKHAFEMQSALVAEGEQKLDELFEQQGGDEGLLADLFGDKHRISRSDILARLRARLADEEESTALQDYLAALEAEKLAKHKAREAESILNQAVAEAYARLTPQVIQTLVIDDKWLAHVRGAIESDLSRLVEALGSRLKELKARYAETLPSLAAATTAKIQSVEKHLHAMGLKW